MSKITDISLIITIGLTITLKGFSMDEHKWFKFDDCSKIIITDHGKVSDKKIMSTKEITDEYFVSLMQSKINQLPTAGDMMKRIGQSAHYQTIEFKCKDGGDLLEFFDGKVKTPGTSFYSNSSEAAKDSKAIFEPMLSQPKLGAPLPLARMLKMNLGSFTVEYHGSEDRSSKETTASLTVSKFRISNSEGKTIEELEVKSGQTPPNPVDFRIWLKKYTLRAYKDKEGALIPSGFFIVD